MNIKHIIASILALFGVAAPMSGYAQQINAIPENTTVILQHSQDYQHDRMTNIDHVKNENGTDVLAHYSHYSHYSHSSHYSHTSHRSHYSHYSSRY